MNKIRKLFIIFVAIIILFSSSSIFADIEISEIMYDLNGASDEGREWIEVFNNSGKGVDFSEYKLFESEVNHKLILVEGGGTIPPKGYAVIVSDFNKFKTDWVSISSFSRIIFDSSFSLSNTGETLAIKNDDEVVDEYIYKSSLGAAGDGNSLQKINGVWMATAPTPGIENRIENKIPSTPPQKTLPLTKVAIPEKNLSKNEASTSVPEKISETVLDKSESVTTLGDAPEINNTEKESRPYLFIATLVLLISMALGAVYRLRRRKDLPEKVEDFEILED
ncbi:MAG TPA: lamin tail domain-containing protein [Candidatus Paceibacterota bacterium]